MAPKSTLPDPASIGLDPPRPLAESGGSLWARLVYELEVPDPASLEQLALAAEAMDTAAAISAELATATTAAEKKGLRHDLLAARAFVAKTLRALRLGGEPMRGPGRPPLRCWPDVS
jgi:hypothetical protein